MILKKLYSLLGRVTGRHDPDAETSLAEMAFTLLWLMVIATLVLVFWPSDVGSFIYEGF